MRPAVSSFPRRRSSCFRGTGPSSRWRAQRCGSPHHEGSLVSTALANVVVEVREISKSYRRGPEEVHALREVSFDLRPGEVVTLVGPSGSGKSTLLNVLCGWEHPDAGEVLWPGAPAASRGSLADLPW